MSAGVDTGPENRGQQQCCGDRHLRPAPYGVIPNRQGTSLLRRQRRNAFERSSRSHSAICTDAGIGRQTSLRHWCPKGLRVRLPLCASYTFLAQMTEQRSFKPQVAGSSPAERTNYEKPLQIFAAVFHLLNGFSVIGHD